MVVAVEAVDETVPATDAVSVAVVPMTTLTTASRTADDVDRTGVGPVLRDRLVTTG